MIDNYSSVEHDAWGGFLTTYAHLNRLIEAHLQEHFRLTHVEFEVLLRLSWQSDHRLRIQDIAAQSILTRSGISRVVERLEKAGLVIREEAPEDRRGAYAVLTEAGSERFKTAAEAHMALVKRIFFDVFTQEELAQMAGFWKRLETTLCLKPK